eukprot:GHVS01001758.1.p1 GENE.GHVS01001758.1~~GHVS01001758.1.p1  ORF type:complete len:247 (-),score=23.95 GHVS01001758.1:83-823(-)
MQRHVQLPTLLDSFPPSTAVHLVFRPLLYLTGVNRQFASQVSSREVLTFFDCDDYMHPVRNQVLQYLFRRQPELDLLLHDFFQVPYLVFMDPTHRDSKTAFLEMFKNLNLNSISLPISYDLIRSRLPKPSFFLNACLTSSLEECEPNWKRSDGSYVWYFARDMNLFWPEDNYILESGANGWPTYRRRVNVEHPNLAAAGEDGLFVWRVIRKGFNMTTLRMKLGAYVLDYAEKFELPAPSLRGGAEE